jgi:hypothetical protein
VVSVLVNQPGGIELRKVSLVTRLSTRVLADRSDRELIAGVAPEANVRLAFHAQRIVRPASRASLAGALRRLAQVSRHGSPPISARVPIRRERTWEASTELVALSDRVAGPAPISPQAIAIVRAILTDGAGPLFRADSPACFSRNLRRALRVAEYLEPEPGDALGRLIG